MSKRIVIGVEVTSKAGRILASVTEVPVGHVRRGGDPKRPFRWTCSHRDDLGLQWRRRLVDMLRALKAKYPDAQRRLVFEHAEPALAAA